MKRFRAWLARHTLHLARVIDPETQDDLTRIQRYNENLNTELTRERGARRKLIGDLKWHKDRIQELEQALKARKESVH